MLNEEYTDIKQGTGYKIIGGCVSLKSVNIIKTERLLLRPFEEKDKYDIYNEFTPEITRYMIPPPVKSIKEAENFIEKCRSQFTSQTDYVFAVTDKKTGEFLGCAALHNLNSQIPECGIWIKKSAHLNAYGLEAVSAIKNLAKELHFGKMLYPVDIRNYSSKRIPMLLGGQSQGTEKLQTNALGYQLRIVEFIIEL